MVRILAYIARNVSPFMPETAAKLWAQLGAPGAVGTPTAAASEFTIGSWRVKRNEVLFPKREYDP